MERDYKSFNPYKEYRGLYDQIDMQKNTWHVNQRKHDSLELVIHQKKMEIDKLSGQNNILGVSLIVLVMIIVLSKYLKFKIQ